MAKSSGLTDIGNLLAVIGGIIMVIFGILAIAGSFVSSINNTFSNYNYHIDFLGAQTALIYGIIMLVVGIVLIYLYKEKHGKTGDDLLIYGIIFIVLGIVGNGLGGLLAIIGGILLIIDFFL